jgi:drug/metabolite transporter (DMT)-like permease
MNTKTPLQAYLALGIGVVILGFSAIFIRLANAPGIVSAFYRVGIAAVVMAVPFYRRVRSGKSQLTRRGVWIALLAGLFFGIDLALWASGIMLGGATTPTLMANTAPIWVGLGAWLLFGERQGHLFWIGLALATFGATIVLGQDLLRSFDFGIGTFLGLLAAISYGAYQLATQRGRANLDTLSYFWLTALSSAGFLLILVVILGLPLAGYSTSTVLIFLALGLVIQVGAWQTINYAQGYLPASIVATTLLGQPLLTAFWAALLLGESFSFWHILGGIAVLAGVFIVHRSR